MIDSVAHELKIKTQYFDEIYIGNKRSEIRRSDDREFVAGQFLHLWEYDAETKKFGRCMRVQIKHVQPLKEVTDIYGMRELNLVVLSLRVDNIVHGATPPAA